MYDVIVIGSGLAGLTAAFGLKKAGKSVLVIEQRYFGGVVNNTGSTRKKELVSISKHFLQNQRYAKYGIATSETLDWEKTLNWINTIEENESLAHEQALSQAGIDTLFGQATFVSPHEVNVDGIVYQGKQFIVATGGEDRTFTFEGHELTQDSAAFLTQATLPKEILLIGAGIISFAFMTIATAFGATVNVWQHNGQALKIFDQSFVRQLIEINKKRGVQFEFNQTIESIECLENGRLKVTSQTGKQQEVDAVYRVAGRVAQVDHLVLEKAAVEYDQHGIHVNDYLQTTQPHIFACGDCNDQAVPKLATYAVLQAQYLVDHLVHQELAPIRYPLPAMSTFSQPKLAQTGVLISEALMHLEQYEVEELDMDDWLDSRKMAEEGARLKVIKRKSDNRIVGATALAQEADLLINYVTQGLHANWTKDERRNQVYAYPSLVNELDRFWS